MEPRLTEDRVKPFRLVKYFAYTGLVVIFLVTVILSVLNTHWVKSMQRKKSEDYAHVMIENLNHQIFIQFINCLFLFSPLMRKKKEKRI